MERRRLNLAPAWAIPLGLICVGAGVVVIFATPSEELPWLQAFGTMTVFLGAWLIKGAVHNLRIERRAPSKIESE